MTIKQEISLSYLDTGGDQEAVLLLHGIMMSRQVWKNQIGHLSKNYRVIAPDLYGFGKSNGEYRESSYEDHATDLKKLLDSLDIDQANIVGWSMGGAIAIAFANLFPDYTKKLVLVDSTPKLIASTDFPHAIDADNANLLLTMLKTDHANGVAAFVDMQLPEQHDCSHARKLLLDIVGKSDLAVALWHFSSSAEKDSRDDLKKINKPTLILCGELDQVCPAQASRYMSEVIPDSQFICMKGLGHAPFLTDPIAFNKNLELFLKA